MPRYSWSSAHEGLPPPCRPADILDALGNRVVTPVYFGCHKVLGVVWCDTDTGQVAYSYREPRYERVYGQTPLVVLGFLNPLTVVPMQHRPAPNTMVVGVDPAAGHDHTVYHYEVITPPQPQGIKLMRTNLPLLRIGPKVGQAMADQVDQLNKMLHGSEPGFFNLPPPEWDTGSPRVIRLAPSHAALCVMMKTYAPTDPKVPAYPCCEAAVRVEGTPGDAATLLGGFCPTHGLSVHRPAPVKVTPAPQEVFKDVPVIDEQGTVVGSFTERPDPDGTVRGSGKIVGDIKLLPMQRKVLQDMGVDPDEAERRLAPWLKPTPPAASDDNDPQPTIIEE